LAEIDHLIKLPYPSCDFNRLQQQHKPSVNLTTFRIVAFITSCPSWRLKDTTTSSQTCNTRSRGSSRFSLSLLLATDNRPAQFILLADSRLLLSIIHSTILLTFAPLATAANNTPLSNNTHRRATHLKDIRSRGTVHLKEECNTSKDLLSRLLSNRRRIVDV
jgi:hypothetical protein